MERPTILLAVAEARRLRRRPRARRLRAARRPAHVPTLPPRPRGHRLRPPPRWSLPSTSRSTGRPCRPAARRRRRPSCPRASVPPATRSRSKPMPAEALVYRLQALLIRSGRHLPTESGEWAADEGLTRADRRRGPRRERLRAEGRRRQDHDRGQHGRRAAPADARRGPPVRRRCRRRQRHLVLDVPYRMGLADLADSPPEEWTDAAFEQPATIHAESGVRVLTWGNDPAESERVTVDLLLAALRWARNHHSYVIVDNHPGYDDRTMAMLAVANEIFLVVTPEVGALRNSAQFLELARELGLGNVIRVIVNRANHGIRVQDMSRRSACRSRPPSSATARRRSSPRTRASPSSRSSRGRRSRTTCTRSPAWSPSRSRDDRCRCRQGKRRWWTRFGTRTSQAFPVGDLASSSRPGFLAPPGRCHHSAAVPTYDYQCRSCGSPPR